MTWLRVPDKRGWWIAEPPCGHQMFVFADMMDDGHLVSFIPMSSLSCGSVEDAGDGLIVKFDGSNPPEAMKDWQWKEIEIPSVCPNFDVEDC